MLPNKPITKQTNVESKPIDAEKNHGRKQTYEQHSLNLLLSMYLLIVGKAPGNLFFV
jgi:hypothetical protein